MAFLDALDKVRPTLEAELAEFRRREDEKTLSALSRRALELAREILSLDEFCDLEFPGGRARSVQRQPEASGRSAPHGKSTGERSSEPGDRERPGGFRINYQELPFEDGAARHSRFGGGIVQVNTFNPNYRHEMTGDERAKLAYMTLLIGKEAIAYNDRSKKADEFLERLLGFYFLLRRRVGMRRAARSADVHRDDARDRDTFHMSCPAWRLQSQRMPC